MSLKQHWTNWRKKVSHSLFLNLKSTFWREGTFIKIWARKRHLGQTLFKLEFDLQDFVRVWINAIELLENFVIDFSQLGTVNFCQSRSLTSKFIIEMNSFHILKILSSRILKTLKFDLRVWKVPWLLYYSIYPSWLIWRMNEILAVKRLFLWYQVAVLAFVRTT